MLPATLLHLTQETAAAKMEKVALHKMKTPRKPARKPVPPPPQKGTAIVPTLAKAQDLLPAGKQEGLNPTFVSPGAK